MKPAGEGPLVRLLRLLELAGGRARCGRREGGRIVLSRSGRDHHFAAELLAACRREDLVAVNGDELRLTSAGLARLRRMQFPEAAFLGQQASLSRHEATAGTVLVNQAESPLSRLRQRRDREGRPYLSAAQYAAGERLRADFERGRLQPRVSASWDRPLATGGRPVAADLSDFAIDARRRVEAALGCLDPELADLALDVCCFLKGFEQVERERRWPPRSAKLMLRTALSVLSRHYGLEGQAAARRRALVHWGSDDYRPAL
ncbi:MAG: hypothetical protein BroJett030_32100 [Alphaproteobacteria bacterium]|nr:MAG: hypothetical protein BroJett030_32100 [Alphaproteobacteria bacterium]